MKLITSSGHAPGNTEGRGASIGRLSIIHSPVQILDMPALYVLMAPVVDEVAPAGHIVSGAKHIGPTLVLERMEAGNVFLAAYAGDQVAVVDEVGNTEVAGYLYSEKYLQLLEQAADPAGIVLDASQVWTSDGTDSGNAGDLYVKIHQGGDPGTDVIYKIVDHTYATFFGVMQTETAAPTINLTAGSYNLVYCDLDQDVTFNITGGGAGQRLYFVLKQDVTGGRAVTFNTNFVSSGIRVAQASEKMVVEFIYDGVEWVEVTGGLHGVKYGQAFRWVFKLVEIANHAVPVPGASPTVEISKNGAAFAGLTGAPSVSEIGSGWYYIDVPAADTAYTVFAVMAEEAAVTAQSDQAFYTQS